MAATDPFTRGNDGAIAPVATSNGTAPPVAGPACVNDPPMYVVPSAATASAASGSAATAGARAAAAARSATRDDNCNEGERAATRHARRPPAVAECTVYSHAHPPMYHVASNRLLTFPFTSPLKR